MIATSYFRALESILPARSPAYVVIVTNKVDLDHVEESRLEEEVHNESESELMALITALLRLNAKDGDQIEEEEEDGGPSQNQDEAIFFIPERFIERQRHPDVLQHINHHEAVREDSEDTGDMRGA